MSYVRFLRVILVAVLGLALAQAAPPPAAAQAETKAGPAEKAEDGTPPRDPFAALAFRNIGPAIMGGRVDDLAVVEKDPRTFYVATASGGLWKTINNGVTFEPVFDDQETSSIGDVTLAPSDPSIVYVGTGEPNNRQSSSWGHGVYRSLDGGRTWTHLGLESTQHIGRLAVHPQNPDIVYVAALGPLWRAGKDRGLYKTTDGGKTWTNVKFINEDTGFVDVAMDPESPGTLYAASYQRRRTPFGYNGGGPGGGLWKTVDGGATWKKLTQGLPTQGDIGRIGIAVYRRDPRIVYALVEHADKGGLYRSEDRGETWKRTSTTNPRPSYYSKVHVDPNNDLRLWVLGAPMFFSEDGGKSFSTERVDKIHGDYHALWIDPADSDHMLVGSDGGLHASYDKGRTWDFINTVALAQFYEIHYDTRRPYHVCGGLQDNGSWCGPSRTPWKQGIGNEEWTRVGGGDGFYTVVSPDDPDVVYVESQDGNLRRFHRDTQEWRTLRPEAPAGERYRFNWNSPILISPHDPKTVYYGGNRVFGSQDRGDTWTLVSADLTGGERRDPLTIFGKEAKDFLSRNDGKVHWGTVTALAESPLEAGILWAGTDDGHLQVSRDGGQTWTDVAARVGVPKGTYVSRVEPSRTGEGAAYAAFDGHRSGDLEPYIFKTEDFGQTWKRLSAGIPKGSTVNVVREHPQRTSVLFAGTERGLYVSWNAGGEWTRLRAGLPTVPVDDVQIHPRENDLILGTHGRGVWILDDLTPLLAAPGGRADKDLELFELRPAVQYRIHGHKGDTGHKAFFGPNPPEGALVSFFLKSKPDEKEKLTLTVKNAAGETVRELKDLPAAAGLQRTAWDLRHDPPMQPTGDEPAWIGPPRGPLVPPGTYTVTLALGGHSASRAVTVEEDPRIDVTPEGRTAWYAASRQAAGLWGRVHAAHKRLDKLQKQLKALRDAHDKAIESKKDDSQLPEAVVKDLAALQDKTTALFKELDRDAPLGFAGAPLEDDPIPLLFRTRGLYMAVAAFTAPPTAQQVELAERLAKETDAAVARVDELFAGEVAALNRLLLDHGLGRLDARKPEK